MPLIALAGPPGVGKTTRLIGALSEAGDAGRPARLFLCRDSEELRSRPHVREGGIMGCRTPGIGATIDHFVSAKEARTILSGLSETSLAVFDEASWFGPGMVDAWVEAERRGVDVMVSSLSDEQMHRLANEGYEITRLTVSCMLCGRDEGRHSVEMLGTEGRGHVTVCDSCHSSIERNRARVGGRPIPEDLRVEVTAELERMKPFPGEKHAYQPLIGIDLPGWELVRGDTPIRAGILWEVMESAFPAWLAAASAEGRESGHRPRFIDLGCCTGFFCEYFASRGWRSSGLDIDEDFIRLAGRISAARGTNVEYHRSGLPEHVRSRPEDKFEVTASFATVQWVIAQSGLDAGLECFDWIFGKARKMCVIEMGYSDEEIYREKLPVRIDREWVVDLMKSRGRFDEVIVIPQGVRGLWRDLFIGLRRPEVTGVTVSAEPDRGARVETSAPVEGGLIRRAGNLAGRALRNPGRASELARKAIRDPGKALREIRRRLGRG